MAQKIGKGNLLTELVKGSLDYTMNLIRQAFYKQFPYGEDHDYMINEIFSDHVIVSDWRSNDLKTDEYWQVTYSKSGEDYVFAAREAWAVVELTYQPQTAPASTQIKERNKRKGKKFEETIINAIQLMESADAEKPEGPWRIKATGITADIINGNGRRYPAKVLEAAVRELKNHLHESAGQGRMLSLTGESDHPADKGNKRPLLSETVFNWDTVDFDGKQILIEGNLLGTSKGKDIHAQMRGGVIPGISQRGYGESKQVKVNDVPIDEITQLIITGYDATPPNEQSDPYGSINYFESIQGDEAMNLEELLKLLREHPEAFAGITEAQVKKMGAEQLTKLEEQVRSALGIGANENIAEAVKLNASKAKQFDEMQAKAGIDAAITEGTKNLPYGKEGNENFIESVKSAPLADAAAVKAFLEIKRKEYDKIYAKQLLEKKGFKGGTGLQVIGDVIEEETGTPGYARASFEVLESVRRYQNLPMRNLSKGVSAGEIFTQRLLERFDKMYMNVIDERTGLPGGLAVENRMLQEATLTTDLNIPYSVSRAIIEEAFPNLVAANIFDVGTIETSPTRLYFETTTGESGYAVDITDEVETAGVEDTWYALSHGRITPGSLTVTSNPAGTTYVEGTDFVIDYAAGRIKALSAGSINANDVLVDYSYSAIRNGEMQPIERVKTSLSYITIEAAADRLADQISREAIVFSRSQLGYDVVARTMANLIKQLRRKIDQGLMYAAFSAVMSVANNSTTPWTVGTDDADLAELVRLMGNANVIVGNRFYEPTFYLMSVTNSDRLSNWSGFMRTGFPNAFLNAAGFAGMVKNKPIFSSTEFPDSLIIAGNRELVQHRVFQPMSIKGPFPTYATTGDVTRLVAADQYYAEEFNSTNVTVNEKGSYVPINDAGS